MSSRGCVAPTERCLHQAVVKVAYDLAYWEAEYQQAKLLYVVDLDSRANVQRYWEAHGRRMALREVAKSILRMVRATRPANRRALWRAFREGWRVAHGLTIR